MVILRLIVLALLFPLYIFSEGITIEASIDENLGVENQPLTGTIFLSHEESQPVSSDSFVFEGTPLSVSFEKNVSLSSPGGGNQVSIYRFKLPGKLSGLYVLDSISVDVAGKKYETVPSTYLVRPPAKQPPKNSTVVPIPSSPPKGPVIFRLETFVKGPSTLYPGQKTELVTRISFNRSIDIANSSFPLVHPAHFKKVGDVHISDKQSGDLTIQTLVQEVEATEIGQFTLGPSSIEGYWYILNEEGVKVHDPGILQALSPAITLEVLPFPETHQPASFTGSIGDVKVDIKLITSTTPSMGDKVLLDLSVSNLNNLKDAKLSNLQCQPGFSGFFKLNDIPAAAEVIEDKKIFHLEFTPISIFVKQIPPIEVSSFNPETRKYVIKSTVAILIIPHVMEQAQEDKKETIPARLSPEMFELSTHDPLPALLFSDFDPLQASALTPWYDTTKVFWLIPLALLLFLMQCFYKEWIQRHPIPPQKRSEFLLAAALQEEKKGSGKELKTLENACWAKLGEFLGIEYEIIDSEDLKGSDLLIEAKEWLLHIQALQYTQNKRFSFKQLLEELKKLFVKMDNLSAEK